MAIAGAAISRWERCANAAESGWNRGLSPDRVNYLVEAIGVFPLLESDQMRPTPCCCPLTFHWLPTPPMFLNIHWLLFPWPRHRLAAAIVPVTQPAVSIRRFPVGDAARTPLEHPPVAPFPSPSAGSMPLNRDDRCPTDDTREADAATPEPGCAAREADAPWPVAPHPDPEIAASYYLERRTFL